jgi:glutamate racemase
VIGFFDSGFGGLSIAREIRSTLPRYSIIYFGDNARTPYGSRGSEIIYRYTLEGVAELFRRGAELIILACNTSSSVALRKIQQEFLPASYPARRVLGIVIPTAEQVAFLSHSKTIGILATEATVASRSYLDEFYKINREVRVFQQACPLLVPMVESGEFEGVSSLIKEYVGSLLVQDSRIDTILLGCTHYALIESEIRRQVPSGIKVVSQGAIVAEKLADYLRRHPEIEQRLDTAGTEIFFTSEYSPRIQRLGTQFFGSTISMTTIVVPVAC